MANIPFIDERNLLPDTLSRVNITVGIYGKMFLRLLLVSREKGLWAASTLRMVKVSFISLICLALN